MNVTVAVPLGPSEPHRDAAWEYARAWWARETAWPIVTGACNEQPYRKGVAVAAALARVETEHALIVDADVILPGIRDVVAGFAGAWARPHKSFTRLTREATTAVLAGADPIDAAADRRNQLELPYRQVPGGGAVLIRTSVARDAPFDPRFAGWGGADIAWGYALTTLHGPPTQGTAVAIHLWHPPQARPSRQRGNPANEALKGQYASARGNPEVMRALVMEAREEVMLRGRPGEAPVRPEVAA